MDSTTVTELDQAYLAGRKNHAYIGNEFLAKKSGHKYACAFGAVAAGLNINSIGLVKQLLKENPLIKYECGCQYYEMGAPEDVIEHYSDEHRYGEHKKLGSNENLTRMLKKYQLPKRERTKLIKSFGKSNQIKPEDYLSA